jgi:GNAT superfamily N-acetyltransferase
MEYKILSYSEFEKWIDQFCELYQKCFSGLINENIIRWRYFDNPYNDLLVCFAIDKGRLVANYAASPCELICGSDVNKVAISLNSMTDPAYRGRGLFTTLASKLYKYMDEQGYRLIMGFPNYLSNRTFATELAWTIMYEIPTLELKLPELRKNLIKTDTVLEDNRFMLNYASCRDRHKPIYLNKTGVYLKWRYYLNAENQYKNFVIKDDSNNVRSRLICKEYQEKLNIVDCCFIDAVDIELLLCRAIEYALALRKEKVTVWSQLGTTEHLVLEKYGFRNNYPITYFGAKVFKNDEESLDIYDFRNWSIHAGDDNVY